MTGASNICIAGGLIYRGPPQVGTGGWGGQDNFGSAKILKAPVMKLPITMFFSFSCPFLSGQTWGCA